MIALTQSMFHSDQWALVAVEQRFEFHDVWGPMLADMLSEQWPECVECEDRSCLRCTTCSNAGCCCICEIKDDEVAGEA